MSKDAQQPEDREALKRRLMAALQRRTTRNRTDGAPRKVTAIAIARWLRYHPQSKHETRRRRVRELVAEVRQEAGGAVAADFTGYWLATEPEDHAKFQEFMRRMGLAHLVVASRDKHAPETAESAGQLRLFDAGKPG